MSIIIYFLFYLLWIKLSGYMINPLLIWLPFSLKIQEYLRNKKLLKALLITLIPLYFIYIINILESSSNPQELLILSFISIILILEISYIFIYALSFLDYLLSSWNINNSIQKSIIKGLYLSFITNIYFTSESFINWFIKFIH